MNDTQKQKLITCILPQGVGHDVLVKLKTVKNVMTANLNHARGMGKLTPQKYRGASEQSEKEILHVMVNETEADELFEYIYVTADINRPHGGMIYMSSLQMASTFTLPDVPDEE